MLISEFSWKSRSRVTALQNAHAQIGRGVTRPPAVAGFAFQKELHFHPKGVVGDDGDETCPGASVFLGGFGELKLGACRRSFARVCHLPQFPP